MTWVTSFTETADEADIDDEHLNQIGRALPLFARKRAVTSKTDGPTGLFRDPALAVSLTAGTWLINAMMIYQASAAGDARVGFYIPAGGSMLNWVGRWRDDVPADASAVQASAAILNVFTGDNSRQSWYGKGIVITQTADQCGVRYAQNVTSANPLIVYPGSWVKAWRVA